MGAEYWRESLKGRDLKDDKGVGGRIYFLFLGVG
jgi:hypothetical protein